MTRERHPVLDGHWPETERDFMAYVEIENVSKAYGPYKIIEGLDLNVADEEFVVLVGPSGCGKTTTLRMIAGLESVTGGTIRIGDRDVTQLRPGLRNCAMVFQNYALYPHMTVSENIGYGMKVRGEARATIEKAVKDVAKILDLEQYIDRRPKQLSGGQRQRVAIGRAIVRSPDVFLFDEPLSNLDAKLRIEMRTEIKALHRRLAKTIVYVTHDQVEAMTMADRVVVMNRGRIEQAADPITIYEKPRNLFVAGFIRRAQHEFHPWRDCRPGRRAIFHRAIGHGIGGTEVPRGGLYSQHWQTRGAGRPARPCCPPGGAGRLIRPYDRERRRAIGTAYACDRHRWRLSVHRADAGRSCRRARSAV
ncbi:ABC transporter [Bradyrhizobium erythrophlei]|nr:ABC transporter [Bradyrhizobium erythrophlei]